MRLPRDHVPREVTPLSSFFAAASLCALTIATPHVVKSELALPWNRGAQPTLRLIAINVSHLSHELLVAVEHEVDSILDDVGVHPEWVVVDPESVWRDPHTVPLNGGSTRADATIRVQISDSLPAEWGVECEVMGIVLSSAPPWRQVVVFRLRIFRVLGIDRAETTVTLAKGLSNDEVER